jgi:hypothetical protein
MPESGRGDREGDGTLARIMSRLGLRPLSDKATSSAETPMPDLLQRPAASQLPEALAKAGWRHTGRMEFRGDVDRVDVERPDEDGIESGCFHRYRTGSLTKEATYRRLEEAGVPSLARLLEHGTMEVCGARVDYDLVSMPQAGTNLAQWFADTPPSEERAWHLFPALVRFLRNLDGGNIRPMVLEPSQMLRTPAGELWMASTGALADASETGYRPEFIRSSLLPHGWSAPELSQQTILSANAAVFSAGQVLAQATWGQPCSHAELQSGAVAFKTITDARLARVMMGCLWPRPSGRWSYEDLLCAVDCGSCEAMPGASPWASLAPGAASTAFALAGASFWRLEDLLATAARPSAWHEATRSIEDILEWAAGTSWAGQARLLRESLAQGRSADWTLVALTRVVSPEAPITWRELDLSDAEAERSLVDLAQRALSGGNPEAAALRDLFQADLRGAFVPGRPKSY